MKWTPRASRSSITFEHRTIMPGTGSLLHEDVRVVRARQMLNKGELSANDVASILKVSRRTLFRELRAARERETLSETAH
jgi:predicted DNA-binding protein (UPF0251 family)